MVEGDGSLESGQRAQSAVAPVECTSALDSQLLARQEGAIADPLWSSPPAQHGKRRLPPPPPRPTPFPLPISFRRDLQPTKDRLQRARDRRRGRGLRRSPTLRPSFPSHRLLLHRLDPRIQIRQRRAQQRRSDERRREDLGTVPGAFRRRLRRRPLHLFRRRTSSQHRPVRPCDKAVYGVGSGARWRGPRGGLQRDDGLRGRGVCGSRWRCSRRVRRARRSVVDS